MPFIDLPALQLNYHQLPHRPVASAPGEDVIMIHGLAANMAFWYAGAAPAFSRIGMVTLYDLRGHGYSGTPAGGYSARVMSHDLLRLMEVLGIERAHLVAHSFGGSIALHFALRHPDRVRSLILADVRIRSVEPRLDLRSSPLWETLRGRVETLGVKIDYDDPEGGLHVITTLARLQIENPKMGAELHRLVLEGRTRLFGSKQARRWLRLLEATSAYSDVTEDPLGSPDELSRIALPVFGVYGENSMSLASGQAIATRCPNGRFEMIPHCGHFFPLTRPRLFAQCALGFLADLTGQPYLPLREAPAPVAGAAPVTAPRTRPRSRRSEQSFG